MFCENHHCYFCLFSTINSCFFTKKSVRRFFTSSDGFFRPFYPFYCLISDQIQKTFIITFHKQNTGQYLVLLLSAASAKVLVDLFYSLQSLFPVVLADHSVKDAVFKIGDQFFENIRADHQYILWKIIFLQDPADCIGIPGITAEYGLYRFFFQIFQSLCFYVLSSKTFDSKDFI